jgi:DNA modification methylase
VLVLKHGKAPHTNTIELGKHGRYRTNVWVHAGANSFGASRDADLADHPTVKPVGLLAEAIRDVTRHGEIVLDAFSGSGSTILACERTKRVGYAIEIEPRYVDVAIARWRKLTGQDAVLEASGLPFSQVQRDRAAEADKILQAVTTE